MSIFNFQFSIFKRAVTWLSVVALALPLNVITSITVFAAPAALGGGAQGNAVVNGTFASVSLADLTINSQSSGDFDSVSDIVISLNTTATSAGLVFDTSSTVTADPSANLKLGDGTLSPGDPLSPLTPTISTISIPVDTALSQIGDSVVVSGIKIKATVTGTASAFAGVTNLVATSTGGSVSGSSIIVDAQKPVLPVVTVVSNNSDSARAKTGDMATISITASETITAPSVTIDGKATVVAPGVPATDFTASRTFDGTEIEGVLPFSISGFSDQNSNPGDTVSATTNGSSLTFDKTAPTISARETQDSNSNGKIDAIKVTLSESVEDSTFNSFEWTVAGYTVSGIFTGATANDNIINIDLSEGASPDTNATPTLTYTPSATLTDLVGNTLAGSSVATTDKAKAVMVSALTSVNTSAPTVPTRINIVMSEDIASGTLSASDFTVTGHTISSVSRTAAKQIRITLTTASAMTTGETPLVAVVGSFNDLATIANATTNGSITPTDGIDPRLNADGDAGLKYVEGANTAVEQLEVGFTEAIGTASFSIDYSVTYDPDGTFIPDGDERAVNVSNSPTPTLKDGDNTKVVLTIADQSQQGDSGGKFKVIVTSNVKDAAINGVDQASGLNDAVSDTVLLDSLQPTVSLSTLALNPTNASPIPVTAQFSETVNNLIASDITVGNGSVSNFVAVDGDTYTFEVTPTTQGAVTIDVDGAKANDITGNANTASVQLSLTYDSVQPTVLLSSISPNPTNTSPIPVTAQFSETVSNFIASDITVGNGSVNNFAAVDGDTYTFDVAPTTQGAVTVDVNAGVSADGAANPNLAAAQLSRSYDSIAPTVTVNAKVTKDTTPELTGTVDDATADVDITVNGNNHQAVNNGNGTWTLADNTIVALPENTYDVAVTATDTANNIGNDATAGELVIDTTPPTAEIVSQATSPTNDVTPDVVIKVENGANWTISENPTLASGTGSGNNQTVTLSTLGEGTHTATLTVTDQAENSASIPFNQFIIDTTKPTSSVVTNGVFGPNSWVGIAGTATDANGVASVNVKVINPSGDVFDGATFTTGGAGITASGATNWSVASTVLTSAILNESGNGVYTIQARATDNAGNAESTSTNVFVWDSTKPVISLTGSNDVTVEVKSVYIDTGATATDNYDGNITGSIISVNTVNTNISGSYSVSYNVTDAAGNLADQVTRTVHVVDKTAPTITVYSPIEGQLLVGDSVTINFNATDNFDAGSMVAVTVTVDGTIFTAINADFTTVVIGPLADGKHTVEIKATDSAGNSASATRTITINTDLSNVSANIQLPANTSNAVIDDTANSGVVLDGINTTGNVTISIGEYTGVPSASSMPNVSAFGKTFEISASDTSMVTFPLTIKIYYTQTDLDDAGITEDKLDGIYFYNSLTGQFERYSDSGVNPTDVIINAANFAGYVYANADHLTPVTAASDVIAPSIPTNTTATVGDGKVTLTWDKVSAARNYTIRYRQSTSSDTTAYNYFDVDGSLSSQEITGLVNGTEYELGVSAQDRVGNRSSYSVVVAAPKATAIVLTASTTSPTIKLASTSSSQTISSQPFQDKSQITNAPEIKLAENVADEGEIKGDATQTAGSRTAVTLAILLLALAAGVGGYYGYEWWVEKRLSDGPRYISKEEKADPTTRKKKPAAKKNNRRNGRW